MREWSLVVPRLTSLCRRQQRYRSALVCRDIPESLVDAPVAYRGASGEDNSRGPWASTSLVYIYPSFRIVNGYSISEIAEVISKDNR